MTQLFVVNDYFDNVFIQDTLQKFIIEDHQFEIMALDKKLKADFENCQTYAEMVMFSAENGVTYNGVRFIDNDNLTDEKINTFWASLELPEDMNPDVQIQLGLKICEISGLSDVIADRLAEEERVFKLGDGGDGERDVLGGDSLGEISQESLEEDELIYANA